MNDDVSLGYWSREAEVIPPTTAMTMIFIIIKALKCLRVMVDLYIGILITATLLPLIAEFIVVATMVDVDLDLKRLVLKR